MMVDGFKITLTESGFTCDDDIIQSLLRFHTRQIQMESTGFEHIPDYEIYLTNKLATRMRDAGYAVIT